MLDLTEITQSATPEQIQKAGACKTVDELLAFAKAEGMNLTAEQAETIVKMMNPSSGEIPDEDLDNVAGGRTKGNYDLVCPKCNCEITVFGPLTVPVGSYRIFHCLKCGEVFTTNQYQFTVKSY